MERHRHRRHQFHHQGTHWGRPMSHKDCMVVSIEAMAFTMEAKVSLCAILLMDTRTIPRRRWFQLRSLWMTSFHLTRSFPASKVVCNMMLVPWYTLWAHVCRILCTTLIKFK